MLGDEGSCGASAAPWVLWGVSKDYAGGSSLWMEDPGIGLGTGYLLAGGWTGVACHVSIKEAVAQEGRYCSEA